MGRRDVKGPIYMNQSSGLAIRLSAFNVDLVGAFLVLVVEKTILHNKDRPSPIALNGFVIHCLK